MKRLLPVFVLILWSVFGSAQVISSNRWSDLFSYNNVLVIREDAGKLIAATENGIFYYTPSSGEITKLSKANGLHEVKISAFDYNPETKTGLVGYANGTMDVITENGITFVVDIPLATGYTGSKRINHISITGNLAVVSVDYGVSIFNLEKKEFGDSAFFVTGTGYDKAREAIIKDNTVYAITPTGIKKHEINVTFPIYSGWTTAVSGSFHHIDIDNGIIAYAGGTQAWFGDGTNFNAIPQAFGNIQDVTVTAENILVTELNNSYSFASTGSPLENIVSEEVLNTSWVSNNIIYRGSKKSGILDPQNMIWKPDGPYNNQSIRIHLNNDKIWVASGGMASRFNSSIFHPDNLGIYFYDGNKWIYPSYFLLNPDKRRFNVIDVVANPLNTEEVFFATFNGWGDRLHNGFYRMKQDGEDLIFQKFYPSDRQTNTNGLTYDDAGNLYGTSSFDNLYEASLYSFDRQGDAFNRKPLPTTQDKNSLFKPVFHEGHLWIPTPRKNNFIVNNLSGSPLNLNDDVPYVLDQSNGLPASGAGTIAVAFDKNDDAWIGSDKGIRIISNAVAEISNNPEMHPITITQNGIGEELFRDTTILQIEVDSGNRKWVSVEGGGVFYQSSDGQKTIYQFTKENSPLPSNTVTDIKVDQKTGKVYFVTFDGIVVYQGDAVNVTENFGDVLVYPNPVVHANYKGNVHIRGLAEKTNIRITDSAGNLVHQNVARGGYYEWDLTNKGKRIASGIYFVLMTNADGTDKATAKIAVVN